MPEAWYLPTMVSLSRRGLLLICLIIALSASARRNRRALALSGTVVLRQGRRISRFLHFVLDSIRRRCLTRDAGAQTAWDLSDYPLHVSIVSRKREGLNATGTNRVYISIREHPT